MKGYANIAKPLTEQLKKDRFWWNGEADETFQLLKKVMTTVSVLAIPNFNKTFIMETDASGHGLGAIVMQEQCPVAYYITTLGPQAQLKSIYEKELRAIVMVVLKWRPYLMGKHFVVSTDQLSLKYILE